MLSNTSSSVREDGPARLICDTRSPGVVALMLVGAAVALLMGLAALVLAAIGGFAPPVLGSAAVGIAGGLALGWLGRRRARLTGTFVVDRDSRVVRRVGTSEHWSFEDVASLAFVVDPTDGMRPDLLPELPHWLVARTRSGETLRLAKGGRRELSPVASRLVDWGLPAPVT